jgi:superfamily II DNA or RNA helicase
MTSSLPRPSATAPTAIRRAFTGDSYSRGDAYARAGRVSALTWDGKSLRARVRGQRAVPYETRVDVTVENDSFTGIAHTSCTCPVQARCKHAAAVVLHAVRSAVTTEPAPSHWTTVLEPLVDDDTEESHLALQLSLATSKEHGNSVRLLARPLRRGRTGAWATTGIAWDRMPFSQERGFAEQLEILEELYSLHLVKSRAGRSRYSYQQLGNLDLGDLPGRSMWSVLDSAHDAGLPLVHATRTLGDIPPIETATFEVDVVSHDSGSLTVTARTAVDDVTLPSSAFSFVGDDGTGLVHWDPAATDDLAKRPFRLARMATPVPSALISIATTEGGLMVPREDRDAFSSRYLPAIRRTTAVVSSDSSFREPVITGPALDLVMTYTPGHRVSVSGQWHYTIDTVPMYVSTERPPASEKNRNTTAELALLTAAAEILDVPSLGGTLRPFVRTGFDAAQLISHGVPALEAIDGVTVIVTGEPPTFEDVSADVAISVSTSSIKGNNDWFDLGIDVVVDGTTVPIAEVISGIARGDSHLILADGRYFDLASDHLTRLRALVEEARSLQDAPGNALRLSRFQVGLWDEFAALGVVTSQAEAWQAQVSGLLTLDEIEPVKPPLGLDATLRTYQLEGLTWLHFIYTHALGGILADDMGLGKTIQTLALVQKLTETSGMASPFLIVAPTSVVHNWAREAATFTPGLRVVTASETMARRGRSIADITEGADIVVTSYTIFRIDFDDFDTQTWSGLVLDEAQSVKNHQGKSYQCARRLETPFKLAITGTPMENSVMELWSLLSITSPGLFPSPKMFTEMYRRPIENDGDSDVLARLRRRIRPLVMRRTKEFVATDLPPKQEVTVEVDLNPAHQRLYDVTFNRERQKILGLLGELDKNRFTILTSLTLLRQLSLDPYLIDPAHDDIPSSKTDELVDQLSEVIAGGHRALVFSQFTSYLTRVRERLTDNEIETEYLDGRTRNRGDVLERFRNGSAPVFLISLKAGGVGLTLTEADYCFVLDPWWNPATEAQAVDRTHRIGQTKTVFVNRYVARGTIEEKVMALKEKKAALFRSVMDDGAALGSSLSAEDIRGLVE